MKPWKQFVNHRVVEIRNLSDRERWQFCPGNLNPADIPSRGLSCTKLADSSLWWNGPDFLQQLEQQWPRADMFPPHKVTEVEVVKRLTKSFNKPEVCLHNIIDCTRFSTFNKLLRVTSYVLKFADLSRQQSRHSANGVMLIISGREMKVAEELWIRSVQVESFSVEVSYCSNNDKQSVPIRVSQFGLFMDNCGLLRCRGRINNA